MLKGKQIKDIGEQYEILDEDLKELLPITAHQLDSIRKMSPRVYDALLSLIVKAG